MLRVTDQVQTSIKLILPFFLLVTLAFGQEENPCNKDFKDSLTPMSKSFTDSLEGVTALGCVRKVKDLEFFEINETCDCFKPHLKDIKAQSVPVKDKHEEAGRALMSQYIKLTSDFAELSSLMPSLKHEKDIWKSCGISKPFELKSCNATDSNVAQKMKEMFSFYMDDNKYVGIKGYDEFSIDNIQNKLVKETQIYVKDWKRPQLDTGSCIHPSFNFFIQKKRMSNYLNSENRSYLKAAVLDDQLNEFNAAKESAFFRLFLNHHDGVKDTVGKSLLTKHWADLKPGESSDITQNSSLKSYLVSKLKNNCEAVNQKFDDLICNKDFNQYDKLVDDSNKFEEVLNITDNMSEDPDKLESELGMIKKICSVQKTVAGDLDKLYQSVTNSNVKPTVVLKNINEGSVMMSGKAKEINICQDICTEEKDRSGLCKIGNIDKALKEYDCHKDTKKDVDKCSFLTLLKEDDTMKKIEREYITKLRSGDNKDESSLKAIADALNKRNINVAAPSDDGDDLLSHFLKKSNDNPSEKVVKSNNDTTVEKEKSNFSSAQIKTREEAKERPIAKQERATQKVTQAPISQAKKTEIDMDSALNRLETAKGALSFGRSSRSGGSKGASGAGSDDNSVSAANDRLDNLMATLDTLQKDNSSLDNLIKNMNNQEYAANGANDALNSNGNYGRGGNNQLASNGITPVGSGVSGATPASGGSLPSQNSISNPSGGEYVGDIARTDLVGKSSTGVSSPDDGDFNAQSAPGVRKPANIDGDAGSSAISKLFQGRLEASKVADNTNTTQLVQVEIKKGVKEVNLAELLKNRDEINPGEAFILYEVIRNQKVEVTLIPTFSNYKGKRFFAGYRPLDINTSNRLLVDKLKAAKNLLTQN